MEDGLHLKMPCNVAGALKKKKKMKLEVKQQPVLAWH